MRLGLNLNDVNDAYLGFARQLGVTDIMAHRPAAEGDGYYDFMGLLRLRTQIESAGLRFAGIGNLRRDWRTVHGLADGQAAIQVSAQSDLSRGWCGANKVQ